MATEPTYRAAPTQLGSIWRLLMALAFTVIGLVNALTRESDDRFFGAAIAILFGLATFQRLRRFLQERISLSVHSEGIELRQLGKTRSYRWAEIERFDFVRKPISYLLGTDPETVLAFNLAGMDPEERRRAGRGFDVVLPVELEIGGRGLAGLLTDWKDYYESGGTSGVVPPWHARR
jgi:hypothetical protein